MSKKETSKLVNSNHYLPHRAPMLMVDFILEIDDEKVETVFEVKTENIFLKNDFFTESGLVENMAQTCSMIVAKDYFIDENNNDKPGANVIGFISGIKILKIYSLPKAGTTIVTKAILVSKFITDSYSLCTIKCKTLKAEEILLEGEITLFIQNNKP
ncbi:putative hotdog family 3-hydroxylacyl-ACP dehydratase [Flavobacterium sp. 1]|uniref:ABC transporter permease n=1 Tax=Flavobacterium sp. 1 TaxID=2035200 RepID=UPI000CB8E8DF|nr:ABC transporter permease [Flavobacterium sp. 1]PJJ07514.1 putative hotdog family 3-hydroxylacyl-ACP dehydratase [Flavobacterium sp. 1]